MDLVFTENQANLGTLNSAVASGSLWTEALVKAAGVLGAISVDVSATEIDLINGLLAQGAVKGTVAYDNLSQGMFLQAAAGSTSAYFAGIDRTGGIDFGADDLEFIFHIEY